MQGLVFTNFYYNNLYNIVTIEMEIELELYNIK